MLQQRPLRRARHAPLHASTLQRWTLLCPWCEWVALSTATNGDDELEHLVNDFMRHVIDEHRGKEVLAIYIRPTRLPD